MRGGSGLLTGLQTFWGLVVIAGLGGYSVVQAVDGSGTATGPAAVRGGFAPDATTSTPTAGPPPPTPLGGYPTPSPLTVFLACNGPDADSVRHYVAAPGGFVVLRADVDRDLIISVMAGVSAHFPANAVQVQSPCMRGLIRGGAFP